MELMNTGKATIEGGRVIGELTIATGFAEFVEHELLPASGIDTDAFWQGLEQIVSDLTPINRELLNVRDELQLAIDQWHKARPGQALDHAAVRRVRHREGHERAVQVPAGERPDRPVRRVRPAHAHGLRLRRSLL